MAKDKAEASTVSAHEHTIADGEKPKGHEDHWGTDDKVNHTVPPEKKGKKAKDASGE